MKVWMKDFASKNEILHDQSLKNKIIRTMDNITNVLILFTLAFAIYVAIRY